MQTKVKRTLTENDYGKLPPQDQALELSVLGTIMLDPICINEAAQILHPNVFYRDAHQRIYSVIEEIFKAGESIEEDTICRYLRKSGQLDACGGPFYIASLQNNVGRMAFVTEKCLYLKELYFKRKLIEIHSKSISNLYEDTTDVFDEMGSVQTGLENIIGEIAKISEVSFSELVAERAEELREAGTNKTYKTGLVCGLDWLDRQTNGFQPTDLIIVAARPSQGKTTLSIDFARKQAKMGYPVGIFSLEMSDKQLIDKMLSQTGQIDNSVLRKGGLRHDQWQKFNEATLKLMEYPIYMCDKGGISINELCSKAKLWKLKYGIKILYVDYIQLVNADKKGSGSREQEVSHVSGRLKALAKDLHIPVVALSQLSRDIEKRTDKKPVLSDLRESGSLEQDADMVIFLHRPDFESEEVELIISKYRNGKTGFGKARFHKEIQIFTDSGLPDGNYSSVDYSEPTPF